MKTIGHYTGARESFFKLNEGKPGDGVCALFDQPNKYLRLYCIRYGTDLIVLGSGGTKPKNIKSLQENDKLKNENYFLRWLSDKITIYRNNGELSFSDDLMDFEGNLIIEE